MFCQKCGQALPAGSNFCPACGSPANPNLFTASPFTTIYRPRAHRVFAGVCAGLHLRYGWDLTATRILAVVLGVLLFPLGELAYLIAWLVMPEEVAMIPGSVPAAPPSDITQR